MAGAGLYFLRSVRPEVSRDYDIFFSAVGLLCGLILLFQGWRLDPILQFGQLLLAGSTVFFAVETIRLRGITTEQARRSTPYADDRRVSKTRVYTEAELDQLEPYEENEDYSNNRRLRGYSEPRPNRSSNYTNTDEARPPRSRRPSSPPQTPDRPASRRPSNRRPPQPSTDSYESWDESADMWDEQPSARRPRRPRPDSDVTSPTSARPRRPRPEAPSRPSSRYDDEPPAAYVDYQPLDESDEQDTWTEGTASQNSEPPVDSPAQD
ncbi:Ycf66 family protein [Synechocystis sp. LKSZ1]